jgi:hypothetical protein
MRSGTPTSITAPATDPLAELKGSAYAGSLLYLGTDGVCPCLVSSVNQFAAIHWTVTAVPAIAIRCR